MCFPSPPKPPDYQAAAETQGEANKQAGLQTSVLNNPNLITPYGTQTVTYGDNPDYESYVTGNEDLLTAYNTKGDEHGFTNVRDFGKDHYNRYGRDEGRNLTYSSDPSDWSGVPQPTITQTLSPEEQASLDSYNRIRQNLFNTGEGQLGRVTEMMDRPITSDWLRTPDPNVFKDLPGVNSNVTEGLYDYTVDPSIQGYEKISEALKEREAKNFTRERSAAEADLAARGFSPGGSGYEGRIDDINRKQNDFNLGATLAAGDVQKRLFDMEGSRRGQDLFENKSQYEADMALRQLMGYEGEKQYGVDRDFRDMQIQEELKMRALPLEELNALIRGMPMQPFQGQPYQGAAIQPAPYYQASQDSGLFDLNNYGNKSAPAQGLWDLAGAGLQAYAGGGFGGGK